MKSILSIAIQLLILLNLVTFSLSYDDEFSLRRPGRQNSKPEKREPRDFKNIFENHRRNFDFFYFTQLWPGSQCNINTDCCYPTTGKPQEKFLIHGFHPAKKNGQILTYCDTNKPFNLTEISTLIGSLQQNWPPLRCPNVTDAIAYWSSEWETYGTCSELDQYKYFATALKLKEKTNILQILRSAGIVPTGKYNHSVHRIQEVIREAVGYTPRVSCNVDAAGQRQLHKIILCANSNGELVPCPMFKVRIPDEQIKFPVY